MRRIGAFRAACALVVAAACARVRPYQRERLAAPELASPVWPGIEQADEHVHDVREGTRGATGATSGGCGCN